MEPTVTAELVHRLIASVVLAVVAGLAVALCARLAGPPVHGVADYVVPHQYESQDSGQVLTGRIHDPRR